jgi:glycosyltransferase involved in cell wall biosynthesis
LQVSVICTVKNEEKSISNLLNSLLTQSKFPDEIIIVDGHSKDNTVKIINSYISKGHPIKLIIPEIIPNISEGRNIAIKNAKYDYIASTDAGCVLTEDWLLNLLNPFKDSTVDVVGGFYETYTKTNFDEMIKSFTYPSLDKILKNPEKFLPSSRCIAFKRRCWELVGGYPENLYTGEDTLFDLKLKKLGCKFVFEPKALVYWNLRPKFIDVLKQHYLYAVGDGKTGAFLTKIILEIYLPIILTLTFLIGGFFESIYWLILIILIIPYFSLVILINNIKNLTLIKLFYIIIIVMVINLSRAFGFSIGTLKRIRLMNYE